MHHKHIYYPNLAVFPQGTPRHQSNSQDLLRGRGEGFPLLITVLAVEPRAAVCKEERVEYDDVHILDLCWKKTVLVLEKKST